MGDLYDSAVQDPARSTVPRRPNSARRTSHVDMLPLGAETHDGLRLLGAARDLLTPAGRPAAVAAQAGVRAVLGPGHVLRELAVDPDLPPLRSLVGRQVGRGFRAALDEAAPEQAAAQTPLYLLVDDLPVTALISGYANLYLRPHPAREVGLERADICAGWAREGTMMSAITSTGVMPVPFGPAAPQLDPDDPLGWHDIPALAPGAMRRRRLVDVALTAAPAQGGPAAGGVLEVRAMFRDTHVAADGVERVLHEYALEAAVELAGGTFTRCAAVPKVLPWPECPRAAASAARLVGRPVAETREFVRRHLRGLSTCTHLNDLLRSLADVVPLARELGVDLARPGSR